MSDDSCCPSCKQVYNIPYDDDWSLSLFWKSSESPQEEEEEEEEVPEEESSEPTEELLRLSDISTIPEDLTYDGENLLPELKDLYIDLDNGNEFHFDEQLFMVNSNTSKYVGCMKIVVEHLEDGRFFVLLHYYFTEDCNACKMYEVYNYGYVKKNFDSTFEARFEIKIDEECERTTIHSLLIRTKDKKFVLSEHYRYNTDHIIKNRNKLEMKDFLNVANESAFILIMRQIAKKDFIGFEFLKSVITNREIIDTQLKCYPFKWCTVNNKKTELKRIRRLMILPNGEVQESNAYLTRNGQIACLSWCDAVNYAVIDPKAEIIPGCIPKDPYFLRPLRIRYLENPMTRKRILMDSTRLILKSKNYLADHPEAMALISFICKQILLTKPHKVIIFVKRCLLPYL